MARKTRAVRLPDEDEKLIAEFLKRNPVLDFSTLTRIAIRQFIAKPNVDLKPVVKGKSQKGELYAGN